MATLVDSLTGTTGVLEGHTADSGHTWAVGSGSNTNAFAFASNRVRNDWGVLSVNHSSWIPASPDYYVEAVLFAHTDTGLDGHIGPAGRQATGANTCYVTRYNQSANTWVLEKVVAGVVTALGTPWAEADWAGASRTVRLQMLGSSIKVYVGGTERIAATDTAITAAGRASVRATIFANTTTGIHMDSITAADTWKGPRARIIRSASSPASGAGYR